MKKSRSRTTSRRTSSRRTPSRGARRDAREDAAAQALNSPKYVPDFSADQPSAGPGHYIPRSLQSGAGRQYWDEVLRLLVNIRVDCDAAAERLGYVSHKDDGLAAVEYIANKILDAVRGERQQRIASPKKEPTTRPPEVQWPTAARHQSAKGAGQGGHSERSQLISELKQMLRDGKTKSGTVIDPPLAHEIAKHITTLNEDTVQPDTAQSIKRIRDNLARFFGKFGGERKTLAKAAAVAVAEKPKRAKGPSRAKTTVAKRSVTRRSRRRSR
jgi:hypothetical protein